MKTVFWTKVKVVAVVIAAAGATAIAAEAPGNSTSAPVSSVTGLVLDSNTKQPVPSLPVLLSNGPAGVVQPLPGETALNGSPTAATDAQGRYVLRFITSAHQRLELMIYTTSSGYSCGNANVAIYQGESVTAQPIEITRYETLRGRVVDPDGKPVAGARVTDFGISDCVTDKDGYFTDTKVPPQGFFSWTVTAQGFELRRFTLSFDTAKTAPPTIQMVPCKSVTGTVTEADRKPAKDVRVYAGSHPMINVLPNWWVPVDDQGRYTMGTMQEKGAPMWLFPVRGSDNVGEPVKVEPGQTGVGLTLYPVGRLEVEVKDAAGKPIANAGVRTMQKDANGGDNFNKIRWGKTDKDGKAVIAAVPVGRTAVELLNVPLMAGQRYPAARFETDVAAGTTAHGTLIYRPDAQKNPTVFGFLVDDKGQPVLHARVGACLKLEEKGIGVNRGEAWTEVDGGFQIPMPYDSGERDGLRAWEPPAPEKVGQLRIVATLAGYRHALDMTREWPKDGTRVDVGRIVAPYLTEWALAQKHWEGTAAKGRVSDLAEIKAPELLKLFPETRFYSLTILNERSKSGPPFSTAAMVVRGTSVTFLASDEEVAQFLSKRAVPAAGKADALQVASAFCALRGYEIRTEPPAGTTPGPNDDWSTEAKQDGTTWTVSLAVMIDRNIKYCSRYTLTIDAGGKVTVTAGKPVGTAIGHYA